MASMFNLSASVSTATSLWYDFMCAIICHFHTSNVLLYCILLLLAVLDQFGAIRGRAHSDMHFYPVRMVYRACSCTLSTPRVHNLGVVLLCTSNRVYLSQL